MCHSLYRYHHYFILILIIIPPSLIHSPPLLLLPFCSPSAYVSISFCYSPFSLFSRFPIYLDRITVSLSSPPSAPSHPPRQRNRTHRINERIPTEPRKQGIGARPSSRNGSPSDSSADISSSASLTYRSWRPDLWRGSPSVVLQDINIWAELLRDVYSPTY